jgi:hypothetical protein
METRSPLSGFCRLIAVELQCSHPFADAQTGHGPRLFMERLLMRVLLLLLLLPILLVICALIALSLPLPPSMPPAWTSDRNAIAAVATGLTAMAYVVGVGLFAVRRILRASRLFDTLLDSAGLAPARQQGLWRCYQGRLQGKTATARLSPGFEFQPWRIDVAIDAELNFRIAIGSRRPLLDCRGVPRLSLSNDTLDACHVHADDAKTAKCLLQEQDVQDALTGLLAEWAHTNSWEIYLRPEGVWARIRTYRPSHDMLERWLDRLSRLTTVCEKTPA